MLYERGEAELLNAVVERHAAPTAEILITDPGRGNSARLSKLLGLQGFTVEEVRCPLNDSDTLPHRGRLLHFSRAATKAEVE